MRKLRRKKWIAAAVLSATLSGQTLRRWPTLTGHPVIPLGIARYRGL